MRFFRARCKHFAPPASRPPREGGTHSHYFRTTSLLGSVQPHLRPIAQLPDGPIGQSLDDHSWECSAVDAVFAPRCDDSSPPALRPPRGGGALPYVWPKASRCGSNRSSATPREPLRSTISSPWRRGSSKGHASSGSLTEMSRLPSPVSSDAKAGTNSPVATIKSIFASAMSCAARSCSSALPAP